MFKKSHSENARQHKQRRTQLNLIWVFRLFFSEAVKDFTHKNLTSKLDSVKTIPNHKDLNELSAEVVVAEQTNFELDDSAELEFQKYLFSHSDVLDS